MEASLSIHIDHELGARLGGRRDGLAARRRQLGIPKQVQLRQLRRARRRRESRRECGRAGVANGIAAVLFPIIITSLLGAPASSRGQFLLIYFLSAIGGIALMRLLGPHMSKHRLWCAAMLAATGAFALVPLLGEGDLIGFMAVCMVTGVALAADLALPPSIQADVVDWDRWRFRRNHPALSFAGASLVTKLALGIAVVTGPLLVSASGWTETGPVSNSVALRLAMIYAWIPCVLKIMAIAIVWNFPLDERRHDMVRSRLRRYSGDYLCADT